MNPQDIQVTLDHRPGALAEFGEVLGQAGVSLEGGGVFVHDKTGVAHFLVDNGPAGANALSDGVDPVSWTSVKRLGLPLW